VPPPNEVSNNLYFTSTIQHVTQTLYKYIRETPELLSMLGTIVSEHFCGPVDFFDAKSKPLGTTKMKRVREFWEDNNVQGAFMGAGIDMFIDGSAFGWYVTPSMFLNSKNKELLMTKLKAFGSDIAEFAEEESNMPIKIDYLPASHTQIKHNKQGIVHYLQEAAGVEYRWETDQVVHIKDLEFDGKVRGFTPVKGLIKEIVTMYMLKENIVAKLQNGGSPDNMIAMKGANGMSRARFQRLRSALESFSHLRKSHGNMVIDAEVDVHELGTSLKDMEYRQLAMFIISEFALALGIPVSRVPFLMTGDGGSANKGELSGNSEDSYQARINSRRTIWENKWNAVFRKAGFTFRFRRTNLQDDVRETQALEQRASYVMAVQNSLAKSGKKLKTASHLALLSGKKSNIEEDDIEEDPNAMLGMDAMNGPTAKGMPGQASNMDAKSKVSNDRSASKTRTASNNERYK